MNESRQPEEWITDLMNEAAAQAVPDKVNLWPAIEDHLRPQRRFSPRRWHGVFTSVAAVLIVVTLGMVIFAMNDGGSDGLHVASLQDITPTVSPADLAEDSAGSESDYRGVCAAYPLYCVPFGENYSADRTISSLESQENPRVGMMLYNPAGVVRGVSFDGVPFIGNPAAPAHFEAVMDFSCTHCAGFWQDHLERFIADYVLTGQAIVQLRLINVPPNSFNETTNRAAYCAGEQGAFWEMVDDIFTLRAEREWDDSQPVSMEVFNLSVERLALDTHAFQACVTSLRYDNVAAKNEESVQHGSEWGVPEMIIKTDVPGTRISITRLYDVLAEYTENAQAYPPAYTMEAVIAGAGAYDSGSYEAAGGEVGTYHETHVLDGDEKLFSALDLKEGWALLTVQGDNTVPHIVLQQILRSNGEVSSRYTTSDGAILFNWLNGLPASFPYSSSALHAIDVIGAGDYVLRVFPMPTPVDLTVGRQDMVLVYSGPLVVKFDAWEAEPVRLLFRIGEYGIGLYDSLEGLYGPKPNVAVLAPHGETLAVFDPNLTEQIELTFVPSATGEQFLVLYPMDTAATRDREGIALHVSIEPVVGPAAGD